MPCRRCCAKYAPVSMSMYSLTSSSSAISGAGAAASTSRPSESMTRKVGMAVCAVGLWNSSLSVNLLLTAPGNWILERRDQLRITWAVWDSRQRIYRSEPGRCDMELRRVWLHCTRVSGRSLLKAFGPLRMSDRRGRLACGNDISGQSLQSGNVCKSTSTLSTGDDDDVV